MNSLVYNQMHYQIL